MTARSCIVMAAAGSEALGKETDDEAQTLTTRLLDREGTLKEWDAALPLPREGPQSCVVVGVCLEDSVGRRKKELKSLQEVLRLLMARTLRDGDAAFSRVTMRCCCRYAPAVH